MKENYITLTYQYHKEDGIWVGICKETGTATSHKSQREVEKQLDELVDLHLECLTNLGEIGRFFKENNIKPVCETNKLKVSENVFTQTKIHQLPSLAIV